MENSLKFFVVALCVTKLIALVVLCRHGKGFLSSWPNGSQSRRRSARSQAPDRSVESGEPMEHTVSFCPFTLCGKVSGPLNAQPPEIAGGFEIRAVPTGSRGD